jgi:hypothetical protein
MSKQLLLTLAAVLSIGFAVGCGSGDTTSSNDLSTNPTNNDLSMNPTNNDLSMTGTPDMSFVCSTMPMDNLSFLNSCAPASVNFVDIDPFYPTLAPGGVLPPLQ